MQPGIHALTVDLRNKIAAGEVVERPASVVKELMENAIDAEANRIDVVVEVGGEQLIQVTDDGIGISGEDLPLAFERYTTSKIATTQDLFRINTLGFRGEALASIASVAEVQVESKAREAGKGVGMTIRNGQPSPIQPAAIHSGTMIAVRNLFYNTPARRKFLKTPRTELRHIVNMVQRFALAHPAKAFRLVADGKELFNLQSEELPRRIRAVFDPTYADNIRPLEFSKGEFSVLGYLGNLNLVRSRPGEQFIFLNGRYIHDRLLNSAVYSGYQSLTKRGEFPFFVLNLSVPVDQVDVNVHPMKLEVRFKDEWRIYHVLKSAVEETLTAVLDIIPSMERAPQPFEYVPDSGPSRPHPQPALENQGGFSFVPTGQEAPPPSGFRPAGLERAKSYASTLADRREEPSLVDVENIWQVHNKYIISQINSGLVIIDQHVAHERVLFEEALGAFEQQPMAAQTLLFPEVLEFSPDEYSVLLDVLPALEKIGFRLKEFGKHTVIVEAVPSVMGWGNEKGVIRDILDHYLEHNKRHSSYQEAVAASFSCHAAIKAGDPLSKEEMQALVNQLFATKNPYYCPHGRPVIVQLTLAELDKRFER